MIWQNIHSDERLSLWKGLREKISSQDLATQLVEVAKFCSHMPAGHRTVDYYTPSTWPSPWEILYNGQWCANSISIIMFYTFELIPNFTNNIELLLVDDKSDRYLLPFIDNKYILNYELGKVNNIDDVNDEFTVIKRFTKEQIKQIK